MQHFQVGDKKTAVKTDSSTLMWVQWVRKDSWRRRVPGCALSFPFICAGSLSGTLERVHTHTQGSGTEVALNPQLTLHGSYHKNIM